MSFLRVMLRFAPLAVVVCACADKSEPRSSIVEAAEAPVVEAPIVDAPKAEATSPNLAPVVAKAQPEEDPAVANKAPAEVAPAGPSAAGKAQDSASMTITQAQGTGELAKKLGGLKVASSSMGVGGLGLRGSGGGGAGYGSGVATMGVARGSSGIGAMGVGRGGGGVAYPMNLMAAGEASGAPAPKEGGTFKHAGTNPIVDAREDRLSTFGIDVDTGSWLYARRFLKMGRAPTPAAVRVEEFVNALHYAYAAPSGDDPFAIHVAAAPSPFTKEHHVVRVALQGKRVDPKERRPTHLTFLVDISGSMSEPDKLPWAKEAMHLAVNALRADDTVAIATYAGGHGLPLAVTSVRDKQRIHAAIDALSSGGGTNMGSGMELAYREANKHLGGGRTARVMVLSDGDANIGRTSHDQILEKIRGYVSEGVTMSTVGFGTGNYNDHLMEQLADAGNGNYTYIDSKDTMKRVFKDELTSTLEVIAQDAKIQVEWNPDVVKTYRLLGYENRDIKDSDFRNDKKDAGEIGAGHAVTALYEVRIVGEGSLGTVRVRSKTPRGTKATEVEHAMSSVLSSTDALDADGKAALGMALGAEILRGSTYAEGLTLADAVKLLRASATGKYAKERLDAAALFESVPSRAVASN